MTDRVELARLAAAATPPPWEGTIVEHRLQQSLGYPNAALIVAAVNYVRDMLAAGVTLQAPVEAERERLRETLERLDLHCENYLGPDHRPRFDGCPANGRRRVSEYTSERWCLPCEVRAAVDATAPEPDDRCSSPDGKHDWTDAPDDEMGWYCPTCGLTKYPGEEYDE